MKKRNLLLALFILFVIGIIWWLFAQRLKATVRETQETSLPLASQQSKSEGLTQASPKQNQQQKPDAVSRSQNSDVLQEFYEKTKADPQYEWKRPINFYGRVVDESNAVVVGASIHFTWNDISEKGTSDANTTSDNNGGFSLTDRRGKRLYVDVGKNGYYSSGNSRGAAFEYANPSDALFTPDPNNPVVFRLRKKGEGADLITSRYGMAPDFQIHIPRDGTPIKVDFLQRKTGDSGQMQITENKPEYKAWKSATNWIFRMEIPDGGFIGQNDEFPFTAPEEGYQSVVEFNFQKSQPDWIENLKTNYYVKYGNPPRYGRLEVETSVSYGGAILIYAINPDGSQNLEPK